MKQYQYKAMLKSVKTGEWYTKAISMSKEDAEKKAKGYMDYDIYKFGEYRYWSEMKIMRRELGKWEEVEQ